MQRLADALRSAFDLLRRPNPVKEGFAPYAIAANNRFYNLAFCDKLAVLRKHLGPSPSGVWATLVADPPYIAALQAIADDSQAESDARLFAYLRLREQQQSVPPKKLLGVVIEVRMSDGLDTLAVYADGCVRYLHRAGGVATFEPAPPEWQPKVRRLMNAGQTAVDRTGPWEMQRLEPPGEGMIRMSFLVSDGLYFGQGPMQVMERDELAQPIIAASLDLLKLVASESKS